MFSDGTRYHVLLLSLSSNLSKLTNQVTYSRSHPDSLLPTGPINTQITLPLLFARLLLFCSR